MSSVARLKWEVSLQDARGTESTVPVKSVAWPIGLGGLVLTGRRFPLTLPGSTFTQIPIDHACGAVALVLGGATGLEFGTDVSHTIEMIPTQANGGSYGIDLFMPLDWTCNCYSGAIGLKNTEVFSQTIEVLLL